MLTSLREYFQSQGILWKILLLSFWASWAAAQKPRWEFRSWDFFIYFYELLFCHRRHRWRVSYWNAFCCHTLVTNLETAAVIFLTSSDECFHIFVYNELLLQSSISRSFLRRENNTMAKSNGNLSTEKHPSAAPGSGSRLPLLEQQTSYLSQLTSQKLR